MKKEVKTEIPDGEEVEPSMTWENYKTKVNYRKFDSDDVIRLKEGTIMTGLSGTKTSFSINTGMMQKVSIIMGIRTCPWFTDIINENFGVTPEIFNKRMTTEFRTVPTEFLDILFKEVMAKNKTYYKPKELQKN